MTRSDHLPQPGYPGTVPGLRSTRTVSKVFLPQCSRQSTPPASHEGFESWNRRGHAGSSAIMTPKPFRTPGPGIVQGISCSFPYPGNTGSHFVRQLNHFPKPGPIRIVPVGGIHGKGGGPPGFVPVDEYFGSFMAGSNARPGAPGGVRHGTTGDPRTGRKNHNNPAVSLDNSCILRLHSRVCSRCKGPHCQMHLEDEISPTSAAATFYPR